MRRRWYVAAAAACCAIAAAVAGVALRAPPPAPHVVVLDRKSLAITKVEVSHTQGGPIARAEIEIAYKAGFKAEDVDEIVLARVEVGDLNPMTDHITGPITAPAGFSPDQMQIVARVPGPASPRQVVEDRAVTVGATYLYQARYVVSPLREERSPLAALRVHDPETWWPTARVEAEIQALAAARPGAVRVEVIGRGAHRGLPITALSIGSRAEGAPALVVVGAIHAGEAGPELILPGIAGLLERAEQDPALAGALERTSLFAVPVVNVDERDRLLSGHPTYLRKSPQGIDLNRNFPAGWEEVSTAYGTSSAAPESWTYRGAAPLSAVEAAALHGALIKRNVGALLSYHWIYSLTGTQLEQPAGVKGEGDGLAKRQAALAAAWFGGITQRPFPVPVRPFILDTSPGGSLVTWAYRERGAPAFEVESAGDPRMEALRQAPPDRALLIEYQARHVDALRAALLWLAADLGG